MGHRRLNILFFSLTLLLDWEAGAFQPKIRNFPKDTYRAGAQNWQIVQSRNGCLYFANNAGALEFDGRNWTLYPVRNRTDVRSLCYDDEEDGSLYLGASNEVGRIWIDDGVQHYASLLDSLGLPPLGEIWKVRRLGGRLFIQENQQVHIVTGNEAATHPFSGKVDASEAVDGTFWAAVHGDGLYRYADGGFLFQAALPAYANVRALLPFDGGLLVVTEAHGSFRLQGDALVPSGLPALSDNVFCAATDGRQMAVGTVSEGIYILDTTTGDITHIDTEDGLQKNTVLSTAFDHRGNLWLGLNNGIDEILLDEPEWDLFGSGDRYGSGYAAAVFDDRLYLGTNQGLFWLDYHGSRKDLANPIHAVAGIHWQVWSLDVVDDALVCSHDKGLRIFYQDGIVQDISLNGSWKVERLRYRPDHLLGSTYDQLYTLRRDGRRWSLQGYPEGFQEASKVIEEDQDGRIWFSHWIKGLFRLTFDEGLNHVETVEYFSERDGFPTAHNNYPNAWKDGILFSTEGGFFRYDLDLERAVPVDALNRLFARTPIDVMVTESAAGERFFSSGSVQGLERDGVIDTLSLRHLTARRIIGFDSNTFLTDQDLLVNTEDGFSLIRTEKIHPRYRAMMPVFIREVTLLSPDQDAVLFQSRIPSRGRSLHLDARQNSLRFSFICPEFTDEDAMQYRYRLDGFDPDWVSFREGTTKDYTRLPPGRYTFRVEAFDQNTGGRAEDALVISIAAPWYKHPWMMGVYVLLMVGALLGIYVLVTRLSDRRAADIARKREEEQKKARMVKDLQRQADDLAASTMNVMRKNQILQSIDAGLERLAAADGEERRALVRKLRRDIGENIEHDDDWQKFSRHFDIVYDDYLKRLAARFPALSVGDKKMCAYLKMDLSSKEIAPLLNMTVRSVEMTRYRLRKKLGLSRDVNLADFLQHF